MAKRLVWIGCDGVEWPLTEYGVRGVFLEEGGISGLVGGLDTQPQPLITTSTRFNDGVARPLELTLNLVAASSTSKWGQHGNIPDIMAEFTRGCSPIDTGILRLEDDQLGTKWDLDATATCPGLQHPNHQSGAERFVLTLAAPRGLWRSRYVMNGPTITVINTGDAVTHPKIRWAEDGGKVILPSGASFTLPTVQGWRTLNLDPATTNDVVDDDGTFDHETWRKIDILTEGVPRHETRTFTIPKEAELHWDIYSYTPWI